MFTDNPVTPLRLEVLLDTLRIIKKKNTREEVFDLFQPKAITDSQSSIGHTVKAAIELGLISKDYELLRNSDDAASSKDLILEAFDNKILSSEDVEPYFGLFYSFMLGLNKEAGQINNAEDWVNKFNDQVYPEGAHSDRFNKPKLSGLHRWFSYVGLGMYDPDDIFYAIPYHRLFRSMPKIFKDKKKLDSDDFMDILSSKCPELDGGSIYKKANPNYKANMQCTLGLSHALIELNDFGIIKLLGSRDSRKWSVALAEPSYGKKDMLSEKFDYVEYIK